MRSTHEELAKQYVQTARAKGLGSGVILWLFAGRAVPFLVICLAVAYGRHTPLELVQPGEVAVAWLRWLEGALLVMIALPCLFG